jgi:thioredoxin reductase
MNGEYERAAYDVAIVGGGPAGLSAAIVLGRACRQVIIFDHGKPRNYAALSVHCFLGADGISPGDLRDRGRQEASSYGCEICDAEVKSVERRGYQSGEPVRFEIISASRTVRSRAILFATGMMDYLPKIPGIDELYGRLVHHCPYCDGWEHRGKHLVAIADGRAAVKLALSLRPWSKQITSCSNGIALSEADRQVLRSNEIGCRTECVESMSEREDAKVELGFCCSTSLNCDAVFFGAGQGQRSRLPQKLGCEINGDGLVQRDVKQRTCIEGVFAAGDAAGDVQLAVAAAAEGAVAAIAINEMLQEREMR